MNEMVRKALQGVERKGQYLFCSESGRPFATLPRSFNTTVSKSGIIDFRFHDLSHNFASNLVMEGADIMTVKELLGHKDLTMTLGYSHLPPNHKTRAINILDQVLGFDMSPNPPQTKEASEVVPLRP